MKLPSWLSFWTSKTKDAAPSSPGSGEDSPKEAARLSHEKREYFSKENLLTCLKYYNEIRFGEKNGSNLIIENETPFEFVIKRSSHENFVLQNFSKGEKEICCNAIGISSKVKGGDSVDPLEFQKIGASFIYDKPFRKTSDGKFEYPSFLYGFDPDAPEIWRMMPEKDRGVAISARKFTKRFVSKERVDGIGPLDFDIRPSEFVGIYGNSGTGKTVLIESLIAPQQKSNWRTRIRETINFLFTKSENSGSLKIDGKSASSMMPFVSYLPQNIDLPKNLKCWELLNLALSNRNIFDETEKKKVITRTLAMCALDEKNILRKRFSSLSGGQRRRMALALTILKKDTRLLIADEPTTGLDVASEQAIMRTLKQLSRRGITVITITHSVASCRLFDRVLILRKADSRHTAEISYNGIWHDQVFPDVIKDSGKYTDAQRIAFLSDPNSKFYLPESMEQQVEWPFPHGEGENFDPPSRVKNMRLLGNKIKDFCLWLYYTVRQIPSWFINSWRMLRRDSKTLFLFTVMAILCVLAMQIGAGIARAPNLIRLFSMLTLAAPWLCATFAAIFMADKLTFYAWEKMSGVHSLGFLFGCWGAQILPVLLISAVFTCGMFVSPDTKNISLKVFSYFYTIPAEQQTSSSMDEKAGHWSDRSLREKISDPVISKFYQGDGNTITERRKNFRDGANERLVFSPWLAMQEQCLSAVYSGTVKDNEKIGPGSTANKEDNILLSRWRDLMEPFFKCYFAMLLIGMIGAAIGIAAIATFRKINNATIAIVVIFIMFLVFSPMFFEPGRKIYHPFPLDDPTAELGNTDHAKGNQPIWDMSDTSKLSQLPAGLISYCCLGRYAFNLICFPGYGSHHAERIAKQQLAIQQLQEQPLAVQQRADELAGELLREQLWPLFVILFLALAIAWWQLWNKTKNWKALTR